VYANFHPFTLKGRYGGKKLDFKEIVIAVISSHTMEGIMMLCKKKKNCDSLV
jgi:hypothetical protein